MLKTNTRIFRSNSYFKFFKGVILTVLFFIFISLFVGNAGAANFTATLKLIGFGISMYLGFAIVIFLPVILKEASVTKCVIKITQGILKLFSTINLKRN